MRFSAFARPLELPALIVEDDHATQLLLEAVLRHEGIACERAGDGGTAISRFQQQEYGAVILDLLLPTVDGFEVLTHLKKAQPEMLSRVIVITALNDSDWRGCEELRDVHCLLRKPLDIAELAWHVRACFANGGKERVVRKERQR